MSLFAEKISEKQFFEDLQKAKICVDNGIRDWFIYAFPSSFQNVENPQNTTLKDLTDIFGKEYVSFFRFAAFMPGNTNGALKDEFQSIQIRPLSNSDRRILSENIRFFPKNTWVCDWRDGSGASGLWPFIQNETTAEITWLFLEPLYNKRGAFKLPDGYTCMPMECVPDMINSLPDYWNLQLAKCKYNGVDILIPLAADTAKYTFKNRDRDEFGTKRHIVHSVKAHSRINSENEIKRHLRGASDIKIHGEDICIMAAIEFSAQYAETKKEKRKITHKKRRR